MDTEHLREIWTVLSATIIKTPNEGICFERMDFIPPVRVSEIWRVGSTTTEAVVALWLNTLKRLRGGFSINFDVSLSDHKLIIY